MNILVMSLVAEAAMPGLSIDRLMAHVVQTDGIIMLMVLLIAFLIVLNMSGFGSNSGQP